MRVWDFSGSAPSRFVVIALLAGCGGAQQLVGVGATPQGRPIVRHAERGGAWMLREAKREDLVYVSKLKNVSIYSYSSGKIVGNLSGFDYASGLCSDRRGNVWVTDYQRSEITEYGHAGTTPIARLSDGNGPVGCAVDPRSGDLAVANYADNFSVYPHGSGNPVVYSTPDFFNTQFCSYDDSGNLFVDGYRNRGGLALPGIVKLPYNGMRPDRFRLEGRQRGGRHSAGGMQWDGDRLVIGSEGKYRNELDVIEDLGQTGSVMKRVELKASNAGYFFGDYALIIYRSRIIAPYEAYPEQYYIALWPYPAGGVPVKQFKLRGKFFPAGLAVSVAAK